MGLFQIVILLSERCFFPVSPAIIAMLHWLSQPLPSVNFIFINQHIFSKTKATNQQLCWTQSSNMLPFLHFQNFYLHLIIFCSQSFFSSCFPINNNCSSLYFLHLRVSIDKKSSSNLIMRIGKAMQYILLIIQLTQDINAVKDKVFHTKLGPLRVSVPRYHVLKFVLTRVILLSDVICQLHQQNISKA